ncbi:MAG: hypothetical protein IT359_19760 [Gemmatimonadaceae bacterium]|nr:hypothetical protein [Gemmatimonadaceae bacterium]
MIDSVDLLERDGVFVSKPNDVLVLPNHDLLVSDVAVGSVLRFSSRGELLGRLGRRGRGPGEFVSPGWMARASDSVLLVQNAPAFRIEAFDLRAGTWLWGRRFEAKTTTGLAARENDVLLGLLDAQRKTSFVEFPDSSSALLYRGRLPADAHADPLLTDAFRLTQLAARGGRIAQAFEVSNWIYLFDATAASVDSFHIVVARRKGAPVRLLPLLRSNQQLAMKAVNHVSQPVALGWLNDALLGLVTVDPDRTSVRYRGQAFVSVVDLNARRACVDAPLDVPSDPAPVATFAGDTLFVVYQDIGTTGAAVTRVRRMKVGLGQCSWEPTG